MHLDFAAGERQGRRIVQGNAALHLLAVEVAVNLGIHSLPGNVE